MAAEAERGAEARAGAGSDEVNGNNAVADNIGEARENVSGRWNRARVFLAEVRNELKRVTWPSRKEVYATTVVVILFSIVLRHVPLARRFRAGPRRVRRCSSGSCSER